MIGHKPHPSRRETYELTGKPLPLEVDNYWLERGVSLHLSAKLLHFIECLKDGTIQARYLPGHTPLHAKIYLGDDGATIGSSNFTESGLRLQIEANARFSATQERVRYAELKQIAENLWTMGRDYRDELIALLEQLLRVVSWQDTHGRASDRCDSGPDPPQGQAAPGQGDHGLSADSGVFMGDGVALGRRSPGCSMLCPSLK